MQDSGSTLVNRFLYDPAPGAWLQPKFISSQPWSSIPYVAESWTCTQFISFIPTIIGGVQHIWEIAGTRSIGCEVWALMKNSFSSHLVRTTIFGKLFSGLHCYDYTGIGEGRRMFLSYTHCLVLAFYPVFSGLHFMIVWLLSNGKGKGYYTIPSVFWPTFHDCMIIV